MIKNIHMKRNNVYRHLYRTSTEYLSTRAYENVYIGLVHSHIFDDFIYSHYSMKIITIFNRSIENDELSNDLKLHKNKMRKGIYCIRDYIERIECILKLLCYAFCLFKR